MKKNLETASPYEGMSENDISNTSLGSPSANIRHNNECSLYGNLCLDDLF